MPIGGGFYSAEQEQNFRAANERVRIGGPDAPQCGARTRTGSACRLLPVKGSKRCLRHCGPKAAREFRERQKRDYGAGRISHDEWERAEAQRSANRLMARWKKDPWAPGATISLGEHETAFLHESGVAVRPAHAPMPAAVLDWLRWQYRRLQIDRKRDEQWAQVLRGQLPTRLAAAGEPPASAIAGLEQEYAAQALWQGGGAQPQFSKRQQLDRPKAPARRAEKPLHGRGRRTPDPNVDAQELGAVFYRYRATLAPLMEKCHDEQEQAALINAMYALDAAAGSAAAPAAHARWTRMVTGLLGR